MLATQLFAGVLIVLGLVLIAWHMAAYRRTQHIAETPDGDFNRRQFRRRTQASVMIVILGVAIFCGQLVQSKLWGIYYWVAVLLIVFWMGLLALADIVATQYHYGRQRDRDRLNLAKLKAELARQSEPRHVPPKNV